MTENSQILLYIYIALFLVGLKCILSIRRDPIAYIAMFYLFFGFGPVVNYLYGFNIYFGIVEQNIQDATLIMLTGIASFTIPHILFRSKPLKVESYSEEHNWSSLYPIYLVSIMYGVFRLLIMIPFRLGGASKVELINIALPSIHYVYLLLQLYFCSFYINIKRKPKLKKIFFVNFFVYILYCLVISERDFIFTVFSFFIMNIILGKKRDFFIYSLCSLLLLVFATAIFFFRDDSQESASIISSILNQGSILFINTYVLKIVEDGHEFFYGWTYVNSIINLIPSWIYKTGFHLQSWFHNLYAKNSTSGYGFALDAEAYINFGYAGVIMFFTSFSMYWKLLLSKFNNSDFFRYLMFFSIGFSMYSLRNDSLSLFKGTFYAIVIYVFVNTTSYLIAIWREK